MDKKIGLIGLWESKNLGDPLLCACTEKLLQNEMPDTDMVRVDMNKKTVVSFLDEGKNSSLFHKLINKLRTEDSILENMYKKYYDVKLNGVSHIVFTGGGLIKFSNQKTLNVAIYMAVKYAEKKNIPVFFHSCGVEGFDANDEGCKRLIYALNSPVTKMVSTRDDLETLANKYKVKDDLHTIYSADSAVHAGVLLDNSKTEGSNLVGIGIARAELFKEYGFAITEQGVLEFYSDIIKELDRRNIKWKMFCNGFHKDYKMGIKVLKSLKMDKTHMLDKPKNHEELVEQVSNFSSIIAMRLHSCITSYALDIPVIGLCWNHKVKNFGKAIGYPERFYYDTEFDVKKIVDQIEEINGQGYEKQFRDEYRKTTSDSINYITKSINSN